MEVVKKKYLDNYEIEIIEDSRTLRMYLDENDDLIWTVSNRKDVPSFRYDYFSISKENYFLYSLLETFYDNMLSFSSKDDKKYATYNSLVSNNAIYWKSDKKDANVLSSAHILKSGEMMVIGFKNESKENGKRLSNSSQKDITIKFGSRTSQYAPFNLVFLNLYKKMCKHDFEQEQIHIEEYMYNKSKTLKKKL